MLRLTFEECSSEVDTNVAIPRASSKLLHLVWYAGRVELFQTMNYTVMVAKTNNDLGNAKEERLCPELQELSLILDHVTVVFDLCRSFQLYPIDRIFFAVGFAVPH